MNRIQVNTSVANTRIYEIATQQASLIPPTAKVNVTPAVRYMVADFLDLDPYENGRAVRLTVTDIEGTKRLIDEARSTAPAGMKRVWTAFKKALSEAETVAEATHVEAIARSNRQILTGHPSSLDNRPFSTLAITTLVDLHDTLVNALLSPNYEVDAHDEGQAIRTVGVNDAIIVDTRPRFKVENGVVTQDYCHRVRSGYNTWCSRLLKFIDSPALPEYRFTIKRHNRNVNGGVAHAEMFIMTSIELIETEIDNRVNELAQNGIALEVTKTPVEWVRSLPVVSGGGE